MNAKQIKSLIEICPQGIPVCVHQETGIQVWWNGKGGLYAYDPKSTDTRYQMSHEYKKQDFTWDEIVPLAKKFNETAARVLRAGSDNV